MNRNLVIQSLLPLIVVCMLGWVEEKKSAAQPDLKSMSPAYLTIGGKLEVTLSGSFKHWPVTVWTDRSDVSFVVGEKSKLTVNVDSDATPGFGLLVVIDKTGASLPVPFVVGPLKSVVEAGKNNDPGTAVVFNDSVAVTGVLESAGDVDCYGLKMTQGTTLVASVLANPILGQSLDAVIQICDEQGFVLDQNDDETGVDPMLTYTAPRDGTYFVRVFGFPATPNSSVRFAGGADYRYLLRLSNGAWMDHPTIISPRSFALQSLKSRRPVGWNLKEESPVVVSPHRFGETVAFVPGVAGFRVLEFDDSKAISRGENVASWFFDLRRVPLDVTGTIERRRKIDSIPFLIDEPGQFEFRIESRRFGFPLDPACVVYDEAGNVLKTIDDIAKGQPDIRFELALKKPGKYRLNIRDVSESGGPRHVYRARIMPVRPKLKLSVAATQIKLNPGSTVKIPVTIDRIGGFDQKVSFEVEGLPAGVSLKPVVSEPKGDSAKTIELVLESKPDAKLTHVPVRIVGRFNEKAEVASASLPSGLAQADFILSVLEK